MIYAAAKTIAELMGKKFEKKVEKEKERSTTMENKANQQSESTKERPQCTDRNEKPEDKKHVRIIEEMTKKYNLETNPIKSCIEELKPEITAISHKIQ